jgi:hypothetical protein
MCIPHPHSAPRNNRLQLDLFWNSSARDALPMFYQTLNEAALRRALGEHVLKEIPVSCRGRVGCWEERCFTGGMWGFLRLNPKKTQGNGKLLPCFYHEKMVVD